MSAFTASDLAVSAQAASFVALVPNLPEQTLRDLERLLLADLASPSGAELREAGLGLLIEMVADGSGEVPPTEDYDRLRDERQLTGERWPDSTTLIRAYSNTWTIAVRAAMRLSFEGSAARVAHTHKHGRGRGHDYTREEVLAALVWFRDEHNGRWPEATQFYAWGEQLRRAARKGGHPDPRIPTRPVVHRLFERFGLARAAAQLAVERGRLGASS